MRGLRRTIANLSLGASIYFAAERNTPWAIGAFVGWLVLDGCDTLVWLTSRPASEEDWHAVKHLLHCEGHLTEMIASCESIAQARFYTGVLDDVRGRRQRLVKLAFRKRNGGRMPAGVTGSWCSVKHLLTAEGHLEESLAALARQGSTDCSRIAGHLAGTRRARDVILGSLGVQQPGCARCAADLEVV